MVALRSEPVTDALALALVPETAPAPPKRALPRGMFFDQLDPATLPATVCETLHAPLVAVARAVGAQTELVRRFGWLSHIHHCDRHIKASTPVKRRPTFDTCDHWPCPDNRALLTSFGFSFPAQEG